MALYFNYLIIEKLLMWTSSGSKAKLSKSFLEHLREETFQFNKIYLRKEQKLPVVRKFECDVLLSSNSPFPVYSLPLRVIWKHMAVEREMPRGPQKSRKDAKRLLLAKQISMGGWMEFRIEDLWFWTQTV